jgi:PIN domain nuclease of toxin-antitoxin system
VEGAGLTYLLDTAPWINGVTMPEALPDRIRRLLSSDEPKGLCGVSLLESAILFRLGRLRLRGSLEQFFAVGLSADLQLLDLSPAIAARTNELPADFPGDPFDRTILATALAHDLTIITADSAIRDAAVCPVEFYPFKPSRSKA